MNKIRAFTDINNKESIGTEVGRVGFKPYTAITICMLVGLAIALLGFVFLHSTELAVIGGVLVGLAVFVIGTVRERPVLQVFSESIRIFHKDDPTKVIDIPISEIAEWNVNLMTAQSAYFVLTDKSTFLIECYQTGRLSHYLRTVMPTKESVRRRRERNKLRQRQRMEGIRNTVAKIIKRS